MGDLGPARQGLRRRTYPVEGTHPGLGYHGLHEGRALLVLLHLQVDAEDPADCLLHPVARRPPGAELGPDLFHRRHHGRSHGVHHEVAVTFHQRHHGGQPLRISRCRGLCMASIRLSPLLPRTAPATASAAALSRSRIDAGSRSEASRKSVICCCTYGRSHGTEVNWVRCVSSCRQTQRRKSLGLTPSSRSTITMFGATSVSRPGGASGVGASGSGGRNSSYWPSTRLAR